MRMITAVKLPAMAPRDHQRELSVRWAVDARPSVPGDIEWHQGAALRVAVLSQAYCGELSSLESQPLTLDSIGMVQSRLLKVTSELERISNSGGVREAKDMLMVLGDIRACCTLLWIRRERDTLCHRWLPMAER
jgi:hypothetical protein